MMIFKTCFSSVCDSGHSIAVVKSAMQKFLRRRMASEMKWCVLEMVKFHFGAETDNQKKTAKSIITNLLNRLIIMCDEELLFADMNAYLHVRSLLETFQVDYDVEHLYKICDCLCQSRLLRCGSDVACYFLSQDLSGRFNPGNEICTLQAKYKAFVAAFLKCRETPKDEEAYEAVLYWAFDLFTNKSEWKIQPIFHRSHPIYSVWNFLLVQGKHSKVLHKCLMYRLEEFHKDRNEKKLFLVSALHMSLYGYKDMDAFPVVRTETPLLKVDKLEIPDYCIDMHCREGRKAGKNESDFVLQGSLVIGEDQQYLTPKYRQFYMECKFRAAAAKKTEPTQPMVKKRTAVDEKVPVTGLFPIFQTQKKAKESEDVPKSTAESEEKYPMNPLVKRMKLKVERPLENSLPFRSMDEFQFVGLCSKNPCGNKVMCFIVRDPWDEKLYVLKEGRKSMAYNVDYPLVDALKPIFGLQSIGGPGRDGRMVRIFSDKILRKTDTAVKSWENNWHFEETAEKPLYLMMNYIEGAQSMVKARQLNVLGETQVREFIKIGIFRGICMPSDYSEHNVLECNGKLTSIDEQDIFGKRSRVVGIRHEALFLKHIALVREVLDDLLGNAAEKETAIHDLLMQFDGFSSQKSELEAAVLGNFRQLREMVKFELKVEL